MAARSGAAWQDAGAEFGTDLRALAAALLAYGLSPGAHVAVLGGEGCDTLHAELAVMAAGGALVTIDPSLKDDALARVLSSFDTVQAIAADERQLARILALRPDLPTLELVLLMRAEPSERKPAALLAAAAMQVGGAAWKAEPTMLRDAVTAGESSTVFSVVGADGKARSIGRAALGDRVRRIAEAVGVRRDRTILVALPRGSVARLAAVLAVAGQGATLLLADHAAAPDVGIAERPVDAAILSVAAVETLRRRWEDDLAGRSLIGRAIARWSLKKGAESAGAGWKHRLAESLTLKAFRDRFGGRLSRLEILRDDAASVDPATQSFFRAIGLPVHYLEGGGVADSGKVIAPS